MFINYYGVESGKMTLYSTFFFVPWLFKMFLGIFIDARLVRKRMYYLLFFGMLATTLQVLISIKWFETDKTLAWSIFLHNVAGAILDVTMESIVV